MRHRQIERKMTLSLEGSADEAFPLFGALREREWAPEWEPRFVAPDDGASCVPGTVFVVAGPPDKVWVMTVYDTARRQVRYVMVQPEIVTSEVGVDVTPSGPRSCTAVVAYRRTALSDAGEAALDEFVREWPSWAGEWQSAVNAALSKRA